MAPEVTSRSRDVNKHGGGVIDLINMQMTYLICKWPNLFANYLLNVQIIYLICKLPIQYANYLIDIHSTLVDMQII